MQQPQLPAVVAQQSLANLAPMVTAETISLLPALGPADLMARRKELFEVAVNVLKEGDHYGVIPGSSKKNLLKPGAEILNQYFGYYAEFEMVNRVEDWHAGPPLFDYEYKAVLRSKRDHSKVGEGVGSCNSYEAKYRYRDAKKSCPSCNQPFIIKGKAEYGGGWICWNKDKSACGAKFSEKDPAIANQPVGKVDNEDIASLKNTILKMAKKRAFVDATLAATGASELFTQDVEDLPYTVEVITAEVVEQASKQQTEDRKSEADNKKGKSVPAAAGNTQTAAAAETAAGNGQQEPGKNSAPAEKQADPKPVSTAGQSAAPEAKVASGSASTASQGSDKVTKVQMDQLREAAKANGWTNPLLAGFLQHAFQLTKETLTQITQKQWETACKVVGRPENAGGKVVVSGSGEMLAPEKCWPKAE